MQGPVHLYLVAVLTLLWNLMGAADYSLTQLQVPSYMGQFTPEQIAYFTSFPSWVQGAWAVAVWSSVAGSLLLLMRSGWAVTAFAISFVAMLLTALHNFGLAEVKLHQITGPEAIWFSLAIAVVALGEWLYARRMRQTGVLGQA